MSAPQFRFVLFGLLYFVQGAALAYFRNFQKPYLDGFGIDADTIGLLTAILLLPFVIKIFIGMLSDRFSLFGRGHRKPYMVLGLLLAAASFGAAAFVSPDTSFFVFALFILGGSFSVALFDSTADGLAIDITPLPEQGRMQGTMVGGRAAGFIVLSLLFGLLAAATGYRAVFLIIGAIMLLPLLVVLRVQEPAARKATQQFQWAAFRALGRRRFLIFAAFAIFYSIASFGVDGLVTLFMSSELGAPETTIGSYGALRGLGAIAGAVAAGLFLDRIGRRYGALAATLLVSLGAALLGLAGSLQVVLGVGLVWGIIWAVQETVFVALAMALADIRIAAAMFAIMMALSNIGTAIGEGLATGLTDNIGFASVFWLLALLNLVNLPILWLLFRTAPEIAVPPQQEDLGLAGAPPA